MKANELRIGNLVNYEQTSHYVTQIRYNRIFSRWHKQSNMETDYECDIIELKPIPLTEEILLKCGFKKIVNYSTTFEYYVDKGKDKPTIEVCIYLEVNSNTFETGDDLPMLSLHQLQNYFYAKTGEELTVNL